MRGKRTRRNPGVDVVSLAVLGVVGYFVWQAYQQPQQPQRTGDISVTMPDGSKVYGLTSASADGATGSMPQIGTAGGISIPSQGIYIGPDGTIITPQVTISGGAISMMGL